MNVIVILLCFFLAAFFHQGLYFIIPGIGIYYLSTQQNSKLRLNSLTRTYLNVVLAVGAFIVIQSILYVEFNIFSFKGLLRFIAYFMFAVLISYMSKKDIKYALIVAALYFIITIPYGVYQVLEIGRYKNIWDHSNHLAYVLSMVIYFLAIHKPFKTKKVSFICIGLLLISLVLTKSTGGLAVLMGLLGYNALMTKRISFSKKVGIILVLVLAVVLTINFSEKIQYQIESVDFLTWEFVKDRVEIYTIDGVNRAGGYGSFVWRIIYWSKLLFTFFSESFLVIFFGVGVDHLTKGYMPYTFMDKDPHNDFIKVLIEYGVLGFILFLILLKRIYTVCHKNFNLIILIVIPVLFGNAIVNYPFNLTLILILMYEYKNGSLKVN